MGLRIRMFGRDLIAGHAWTCEPSTDVKLWGTPIAPLDGVTYSRYEATFNLGVVSARTHIVTLVAGGSRYMLYGELEWPSHSYLLIDWDDAIENVMERLN